MQAVVAQAVVEVVAEAQPFPCDHSLTAAEVEEAVEVALVSSCSGSSGTC